MDFSISYLGTMTAGFTRCQKWTSIGQMVSEGVSLIETKATETAEHDQTASMCRLISFYSLIKINALSPMGEQGLKLVSCCSSSLANRLRN